MSKYTLLPEHEARFPEWRDRWIANALSCEPMSESDGDAMRAAIEGLYAAAKLDQPKNVVFCPSPISGYLAAAVASGVWYLRDHPELFGRLSEDRLSGAARAACGLLVAHRWRALVDCEIFPLPTAATRAATRAATVAATDAATRDATSAATDDATRAATDAATSAATDAATVAATHAATRAATHAATHAATSAATDDATDAATRAATRADPVVAFLVYCVTGAWRLRNGGNQWSGWCAYLSFFRHVAQLPIDYSKWAHYEAAAVHGGPRYMHAKFAIVSDRPSVLRLDDRNLPHCADGPSHVWRDGWELYYWHGVRVPRVWIRDRSKLAPRLALTWPNLEQRRALAEIVGWDRLLDHLNPRLINKDRNPLIGQLLEVDIPDSGRERFLRVQCGTGRWFVLGVPPEMRTAREAQMWLYPGIGERDLKGVTRT